MYQLAAHICKILPAVATSNAVSSTFMFKDDDFKDTIIDICQFLPFIDEK